MAFLGGRVIGTGHVVALVSSSTPDISFTPQQKALMKYLFGIDAPQVANDTPLSRAPNTPTTMETKVQAMVNGIKFSKPSWGDTELCGMRPFFGRIPEGPYLG